MSSNIFASAAFLSVSIFKSILAWSAIAFSESNAFSTSLLDSSQPIPNKSLTAL